MSGAHASASSDGSGILLVVAASEEPARRVEAHLRRCGHRVRTVWIRDRGELEKRLREDLPDLVLASEHVDAVPVIAVVETCRRFAPEVPVLVLAPSISTGTPEAALSMGARDRVGDGDAASLAHLERVFAREMLAHRNARDLSQMRRQFAEQTLRYTRLFDEASDALAQFQDGILVRLNPAFAALLGYDNGDALTGTPLMDLVTRDHQPPVREHLKSLGKPAAGESALACSLAGAGGAVVAVQARFHMLATPGGSMVELFVRRAAQTVRSETPPPTSPVEPAARYGAATLRSALREDRMRLVYRPIRRVEDDGAHHLDLSLRLIDDETLPEHALMEAAENAGMMRAIDRWTMGRSLRALAARKRSGRQAMLFVALSGDTLRDADAFLSWFQSLTQGQMFARDELCLQIAEPLMQARPDQVLKLVGVFRDMGARLAITHFGLSQASARQLEILPCDFVKFDAAFSQRPDDRDLQASLSRLVALARQRQIATILHHLHDSAALARAWQMGVDFIRDADVQTLDEGAPLPFSP